MGKCVLFICYWGLKDTLTASTVLPRLEVLQNFADIERILFVTIERDNSKSDSQTIKHLSKVLHQPLFPVSSFFKTAVKIRDFLLFPKQLAKLVQKYNISIQLAHGAPAGGLANKVWQQTQVPYFVSSYEPHADYMLESGVWKKSGLKYMFQRRWEEQQKKNAAGLMPVADNYKLRLMQDGVPEEKVFTVACSVEAELFSFDPSQRKKIREQLGWQHNIIGIYVGKYGGLYYEAEAFAIYKTCFESVPDFRLLVLSPQPKDEILRVLQQHQIEAEKVYVASVPHQEVPKYLSAADFAFATYKPGPSKKYLSPIKIGEYWANGLPVLLTEGVGDDSDIIKTEGGGAIFNLQEEGSVEKALQQIQQLLKDPSHRQEIPKLAKKYRSPERIREAYEYFFGKMEEQQR